MKTVSDYQNDLYVLLGDASGRRYTTTILNMALSNALKIFGNYYANKEDLETTVTAYDGALAALSASPDPGAVIITVKRVSSGKLLDFAEYRNASGTRIGFYAYGERPEVGETLVLGLAVPHTIEGLDSAEETTVPDVYAGIVEKGAAAEAMRIRARSVTEVFGKRPEDAENLIAQAEALEAVFYSVLNGIARTDNAGRDPWPRKGFPI